MWRRETVKAVTEGSRVFHSGDELGSQIAVSCDMCHPNAANTHPETYPKFQEQLGRVALLRDMINWCIEHPVRGTQAGARRSEDASPGVVHPGAAQGKGPRLRQALRPDSGQEPKRRCCGAGVPPARASVGKISGPEGRYAGRRPTPQFWLRPAFAITSHQFRNRQPGGAGDRRSPERSLPPRTAPARERATPVRAAPLAHSRFACRRAGPRIVPARMGSARCGSAAARADRLPPPAAAAGRRGGSWPLAEPRRRRHRHCGRPGCARRMGRPRTRAARCTTRQQWR